MEVVEESECVEPPGELSLWPHIPSENKSFSFFTGPIRLTRDLLLLCNIEEKEEEQRDEIPTPTTTLEYFDIFFPLYVTITSLSDGKNRIFTLPGG